jgi:glutathione S-transferase
MSAEPQFPVLYGRHASPFVRRVAVTMRLYGIAYRHKPLMPFGPDKAELAKFNPIARVPALQLANGEMLIDSAAILDYLDQLAGPERALTPAAGPARRRVLTLLAVAHGANEKLVAALYERHFRPREAQHAPWLAACDKQVRDGFGWLNEALPVRGSPAPSRRRPISRWRCSGCSVGPSGRAFSPGSVVRGSNSWQSACRKARSFRPRSPSRKR